MKENLTFVPGGKMLSFSIRMVFNRFFSGIYFSLGPPLGFVFDSSIS